MKPIRYFKIFDNKGIYCALVYNRSTADMILKKHKDWKYEQVDTVCSLDYEIPKEDNYTP